MIKNIKQKIYKIKKTDGKGSEYIALQNNLMPVVVIRGVVVFPGMVVHFDISRVSSVKAVDKAVKNDRLVFFTMQKSVIEDTPSGKDICETGVIVRIRQHLKTPDNVCRLLVEGISKARIVKLTNNGEHLEAEVVRIEDNIKDGMPEVELEAIVRSLKGAFRRFAGMLGAKPEMLDNILLEKDPLSLFRNVVYNINLNYEDSQALLEQSSLPHKLSMLYAHLLKEIEILEVEYEIHSHVRENISKFQREGYLREQMRVISAELDGEEDINAESQEYFERITALQLPEKTTEKLLKEVKRLVKLSGHSHEVSVIRNYLDTCLDLPWNKSSNGKINIFKAEKILNKDHYGLDKVKQRILESIAVHALKPEESGHILCLVGPPGVGKTSIGKSVAKALGRKYARISLGGVHDESDIRGHRRTYVGAMPGRIMDSVRNAGTNNPLMLFDEIDKMSNDFRGDPASAMLEVLDSEQNKEFTDHYLDLPFDLSNVFFMTTANTTHTIPPPLLDRMEVIEITSYTREEKFNIAREHLIPKQIKKNGLKGTQVRFEDSAVYSLIDFYTREAGVRGLERVIASLCRKAAKDIVSEQTKRVVLSADIVRTYLGIKKYQPDFVSESAEIGMTNGLAWSAGGGSVMPLEVLVLGGKGAIEITGSLGDIMKESAKIAVSYTRSIASDYGIEENFYRKKDLHIHAPEGAIPKDGPSAGVTIATSMVSALSGIPVKSDIAMTGEITLHGKVLPIGGLKEKTMAAYKAGIKTVIVPEKNRPDIEEIDSVVKDSLHFVYAENLKDVLSQALLPADSYSSL
ncbi:MAG: endopeptidase La [Oscillospiraceae bacterium]|jgi:ATP-dependent Lon protease|nr:endopeptidase La [Oscillospiraceae bacterium]